VVLPAGTSPTALLQARSTAAADQQNVVNAEAALANAKAIAGPERAATLLAAKAAVSSDETALASAKDQLASDEELSCPSSSSSTVTAAAHALSHDTTTTTTPASAPSPSTGAADETTSTSSKLMGTVDPNGAETTYYFEYGTSPNYGQTTSSVDAGSGTNDLSISTVLSGCCPARPTTTPRRDQLTRYLLRPRRYVHHQRRALGDDGHRDDGLGDLGDLRRHS